MKKRILLVNEDPAVRRMMFRVLTGEGHQVIVADPDVASVRRSLHGDLDVIVLDSEDEQILSALERWASQDHSPPTILLNGQAKAVRPGGLKILAVMEKPLDLPHFLEIIQRLPGPASATQPQPNGLASAA